MNVTNKLEKIARIAGSEDLTGQEKIGNIKQTLLIGESRSIEEILSSIFMVVAGILLIVFMVFMEATYYETQEIGDWKMKAILALAGGAMSVGFTGNINIKFHWVQASGSLAVVLVMYFVNPISIEREVSINESKSAESTNGASLNKFSFMQSAYAEGSNEDGSDKHLTEGALKEEDAIVVVPHTNASESETNPDEQKYNFKIVYPIGITELKNASFKIGKEIRGEKDAGKVKVYSVGSVLRAPINALTYDGGYNIKIKYNRLVDDRSISAIKQILEERSVSVETDVANPRNSDIEIGIVPK